MSLGSVDLPHPDGPRMATNEPSTTSRSMPSSATVPSPNTWRRPWAETRDVRSSAARELKTSPELLPDLVLDARPELVAGLLGRPRAREAEARSPSSTTRAAPAAAAL